MWLCSPVGTIAQLVTGWHGLESYQPFNSQDLIVNSPLLLLQVTLFFSYENLVLKQDKIFCLINLCILFNCLLDNVWIF